ncbi:voltage-gated chloride channel family protein [Desertivirga xinjiangensis]|uniref:voltage-gated chloride channel family protein n=1 Tax=Desertivirga xinjiangensis TaxID=539206 RepID=UPI00210BCF98|nr:voltage-gated chloride channel family protein [Pedobacter xinjiangensis]
MDKATSTKSVKENLGEQLTILKNLLKWTFLVIPVAIASGVMVALFLTLLHAAIAYRFSNTWLLYLLPLAGVLIHFIYQKAGKSSEKGNNLIVDEIHEPGAGVPKRMGIIILITTVITHLFGGSAGREGTAVQIGGSVASMFSSWCKLKFPDTKILLTAGVAAAFGAVFGTPLTGAIFAIEVLAIGRIQYSALLPCLIAGIIGDLTVTALGVHHTTYHIDIIPAVPHLFLDYFSLDLLLLAKIFIASIGFGLASYFFSELTYGIKNLFLELISRKWLIPVLGGGIIIALTFILGKPDYLSLGVDAEYSGAVTISSAFKAGGADWWSWFWKSVYTAITLGSGFKGGEVTPLFYIGATLGNTLSEILNAPTSLLAALGFIAVFAGATNTPLACTLMGIELFGGEYALFYAVACFTAYYFSGHSGIYTSQRIAVSKSNEGGSRYTTLGDIIKHRRNRRKNWFKR